MKNAEISITPELLRDKEVARMLGLSTRSVHTMRSCGRLPREVRLGRSLRWRRRDIEKWVEMNCPSREQFEAEREVIV